MNPLTRIAGVFAARSPRERQLLAVAAIVVSASALFRVADQVWDARAQLARRLPEARSQLARMQEDAAELQRLRRAPLPAAAAMPTVLETARAAAASRALPLLSIALSGETLQVRGAADFAMLIEWLADMHAELGLRPQRAVIAAQGDTVSVDIDLTRAATP
ncbi:type II secretion system protein GspM [Aromatoleum anaerobium]|uniref:General secretion pathway protein M n=1 Tax=Aromatoleum anaerobium TaxID=182180 RepID=A0ABX1PI49_9RHOO|nr:type II secretion system protein GspM [Aromatoleum anaerobium]MCK0508844.1 type II secretion system protein M [Aromatoleum anaerobium]